MQAIVPEELLISHAHTIVTLKKQFIAFYKIHDPSGNASEVSKTKMIAM
jgi:hypothetical protein